MRVIILLSVVYACYLSIGQGGKYLLEIEEIEAENENDFEINGRGNRNFEAPPGQGLPPGGLSEYCIYNWCPPTASPGQDLPPGGIPPGQSLPPEGISEYCLHNWCPPGAGK